MSISPGTRLGPYEIVGPIGAGGMGEVYKARDTRLDRLVAIKVLPADKLTDPERRRRFLQEAKSASALNHPNIVTLHDVGTDHGVDFLAMELVSGRTLEELTPRNGLRIPELLRYAVQIADALARAHSAGIVHRDLKPGNVMITADGLVKVLDFGLAKLAQPSADQDGASTATVATDAGMIVGTASFMSPEQAEGKAVDARSDVFSFGAMLYEMATGQRAFRGDSAMSTISAVLRDEPASIASIRQEVPGELERVVKRCLRKDPARRFQTMADLKVALEELKDESDSGSLTSTRPVSAARPVSAFRWWMVATAAVVVGAAVIAWSMTRPPAPEPVAAMARPTPLTSFVGDESSATFSPDGNQMAFMWNGDKQDNYDIYVKVVGAGSPLRLTTDPSVDFSPAWSPDGRTIAFVRRVRLDGTSEPLAVSGGDRGAPSAASNTVMLMPALGGSERVLARFEPGPSDPRLAWSPDGRWLVASGSTGRSNALHLISVETGDSRVLTTPPDNIEGDFEPAFAPNGRALAFTRLLSMQVQEVRMLTLSADLQPQGERRLTTGSQYEHGVRWTPDSKEVLYASGLDLRSNIYRVPVDGSRPPALLESLGDGARAPVVSPNGQRLIFERFGRRSSIQHLDLRTPTPVATPFIASNSREAFAQYSPDGKRVVFYSNRSGSNQIWVCDADGGRAAQVTSMPGTITGTPRWSPDGQRISFDSNSGGRWRIYVVDAGGGKPTPVTTDTADHFIASWSHDGQWIYVTSGNVENIWKVPSRGGEAVQITRNGGNGALESLDGSTLYFVKSRGSLSSLWAIPVGGGEERELASDVFRYNFAVAQSGIYYVTTTQPDRPSRIEYLDLKTGKVTPLFTLSKPVDLGLTVSPDEKQLLFGQSESYGSDLMLVENFR